MIGFAPLWIPLLISAVAVFFASSLIHMVLKWHNSDYAKLDNEDAVRAAIRAAAPAPGQYMIPNCADMKEIQSPEMQAKFAEGPVGLLILRRNGVPGIGPSLMQWFALNLLVAVVVTGVLATLAPGSSPHAAFHDAALITFVAYTAGSISNGAWRGQPWKAVAKDALDALIFALITGFIFAWQWPH